MPVIVNQQSIPAEQLGLRTIDQVLSHVHMDNRVVVHLLIDGQPTALDEISRIRKSLVVDKTLYIETAELAEIAADVLDEAQEQLTTAEAWREEAAALLEKNQLPKAMEKLGAYFNNWHTAQQSIIRTSQLLHVNLESLRVQSRPVTSILAHFTAQLRQIKQTLVDRDFVSLIDVLLYEAPDTYLRWIAVLNALRDVALAPESLPHAQAA